MNQKQLSLIRTENSWKIDKFRLSHSFGCVRINSGNTLKHELAKVKEVYKALKKGEIVATEVWSADGKRKYDYFNFDSGEIKEFETGKSYDKKDGSIKVSI